MTCNPFSKFHTKTKNEKENQNPFFLRAIAKRKTESIK